MTTTVMNFDPKAEYGFAVEWSTGQSEDTDLSVLLDETACHPIRGLLPRRRVIVGDGDVEAVHSIKTWLIANASKSLPAGAVFDIRGLPPSNYGRDHGLAWYYDPARPKDAPPLVPALPFFDRDRGFVVHGSYVAGENLA